MKTAIALVLAAGILTACGMTGDLYLPKESPKKTSEHSDEQRSLQVEQ